MAADIKNIGKATYGVNGWTLTESVTLDNGGIQRTYEGRIDNLEAFKTALKAELKGQITESKNVPSGMATVVHTSYTSTSTTGTNDDQIAPPTVTLTGTMQSVPIYQMPYFKLGETDGLTAQQIKAIDYAIREYGTVSNDQFGVKNSTIAAEYAGWIMAGVKTALIPVYNLTASFRLIPGTDPASYIQTAGDVVTWAVATNLIPSEKLPPQPEGFDQWLVNAPTISCTNTETTVNISFTGAKAFPTFYTGGTWAAPEVGVYWRDAKIASGAEAE